MVWYGMECDMRAILPLAGMVLVILAQVSNMEVTKLAISLGINKYVLVVYSDALSTLLLLPSSFIAHRSSSQIFGYVGLQYSTPTLGTAMLNLIPAFTFILALIFRLEKLDFRTKSSLAKSIGTIVSIAGAFVVTFYKGPSIFGRPSQIVESQQLFYSPELLWLIGAFFLAAEAFMTSCWYILQTFILEKFPAVLIITCYLFFFNTLLSAIFALIVVKDTSAWKLKPDIGLVAILYAAIIGLAFRVRLAAWCLSKTGPLYVSMFKPLAIVFAVFMDAIFLADTLSLGSLIGGIIIVSGFYSVMWGKPKEEKTNVNSEIGCSESTSDTVPLLPNKIEEI